MLIKDSIYYVGVSNKQEKTFEGVIPTPFGMNYNSYLILDDKTVLLDTVDASVHQTFIHNVLSTLNGRSLDYLVIHHLEPDHTSGIIELLKLFPSLTLVISPMGLRIFKQFFDIPSDTSIQVVNEDDTLSLGHHTLKFISAPMVHWPEVMMSFESDSGTLFSADAFGAFGAIPAEDIYASSYSYLPECLPEARRYYTNIVGKYGEPVQNLLKKVESLPIKMIAPLHGHIFDQDLSEIISFYQRWSSYTPECEGVLILSASIYGHTYAVAESLYQSLKKEGIDTTLLDLNITPVSEALSLSFKYHQIVLCSSTFNMGLFTPMENYLLDIKAHQLTKRTFTLIENGSWAPQAGRLMKQILETMEGNVLNDKIFTIRSSYKEDASFIQDIQKEVLKSHTTIVKEEKVTHQWKCQICGYIYEGEELPSDFTCPICGRPASDFQMIK